MQPKPADYGYDLDHALTAVVGLKCMVPPDAFTAETLGTERIGNGVLIDREGLILTIGYLITEAEAVWVKMSGGQVVKGHALGYDQATGFGLIQALARLDAPTLPLGSSAHAKAGDAVVVAAAGGRQNAIAAQIRAKQEFAGYWEYVLDEALFTAPAHPTWSGTALIGSAGDLIGIGSLQLQQQGRVGAGTGSTSVDVNMMVPIDLLKPILHDLRTIGKRREPPRPWLGLYATEVDRHLVVAGVSARGPARKADLRPGDMIISVADHQVSTLAELFRAIWAQGEAGVEIAMLVARGGDTLPVRITSADRDRMMKGPILH